MTFVLKDGFDCFEPGDAFECFDPGDAELFDPGDAGLMVSSPTFELMERLKNPS